MDGRHVTRFRSLTGQLKRHLGRVDQVQLSQVTEREQLANLMDALEGAKGTVDQLRSVVGAMMEELPSAAASAREDGTAVKVRPHKRSKPRSKGSAQSDLESLEDEYRMPSEKPALQGPAGRPAESRNPSD